MIDAARSSVSVKVDDPSRVGEARRRASDLADRLGFDATRRGTAALLAAEAASNLAKHATGGELILAAGDDDHGRRLDVIAVDRGPGMEDVGRCLRDGYSTTGSLGTGLGAIGRLADRFAIHSRPRQGTILWARLESRRSTATDEDLAAVNLPAEGEDVCGDAWDLARRDESLLVMVADGLGHGPAAAEAAEAAVDVFRSSGSSDPVEILDAAHARLRATRGAAMAVTRLDARRGEVVHAGVGNVAGVIVDPATGRSAHLIGQNGTVGHTMPKDQAHSQAWPEDAAIILHSDGVSGRWDLGRDPALAGLGPGLLAGLLHRDHRRARDDATLVVARRRRD